MINFFGLDVFSEILGERRRKGIFGVGMVRGIKWFEYVFWLCGILKDCVFYFFC